MSPSPTADSASVVASTLGRIDQFELVRKLERGVFGAAYQAKDTLSGTDVMVRGIPAAVKDNTELRQVIRGNFEFMRRLHHPHIAEPIEVHTVQTAVYNDPEARRGLCVTPGDALLVTALPPGEPLAVWRASFPGARVPVDKALDVVRPLAAALDYAHASRILHNAVMPENVVVETRPDGSLAVRIIDFGLQMTFRAALHGVANVAYGKSEMHPYRAPEYWRGRGLHRSSDQYSLAVVFAELVTGVVPFANVFATGNSEMMAQTVSTRDPDLPDDCPRRDVLLRALNKDAHARFASCSEFVRALEDPQFLQQVLSAPTTHQHHHRHDHHERKNARRPSSARRFKLTCAVGALAVAAGLGWAIWSGTLDVEKLLNPLSRSSTAARPRASAAAVDTQIPAAGASSANDERLRQIQEEIVRQQGVSDKALKDFQQFMETAGPLVLEVKRDEARRTLERTTQTIRTYEDDLVADRNRVKTLEDVRSLRMRLDTLPSDLQKLPELNAAHTNLVSTERRLYEALARYTDKHPTVLALQKESQGVRARFLAAVDSALEASKTVLKVHAARVDELRVEEPRQREELARLERESLAAKTRQDELDRIRIRESSLLSDLRRMEYAIRFGTPLPSQSSATNATTNIP